MVKSFLNILLITLFVTVFTGCSTTPESDYNKEKEQQVHIPKMMYGINVDTLSVVKGKVKKNEFLSDILLRFGVSYGDIDHIARNTKKVFDVRKIVAGNRYSVICSADSLNEALYFAYELSASKYILYSLFDTIIAQPGEKEIVITEDTTTGVIKSSLWNAMVDNGSDPNLANELSEIYAWTIDFFGLQKGDTYKAIFEEQFVDSSYIGLAEVMATMFYHEGDSLYAFYFEQNGKGDYFDEKGNSLQRTFLKAPLRFTRISSTASATSRSSWFIVRG